VLTGTVALRGGTQEARRA